MTSASLEMIMLYLCNYDAFFKRNFITQRHHLHNAWPCSKECKHVECVLKALRALFFPGCLFQLETWSPCVVQVFLRSSLSIMFVSCSHSKKLLSVCAQHLNNFMAVMTLQYSSSEPEMWSRKTNDMRVSVLSIHHINMLRLLMNLTIHS